jgi:ATP-binding cassette subfamily G (WHITE) protein 2 (PDR)
MDMLWDSIANISGGLNVEQRKKLTIGVELAARPQLLLFLDEPSSGLDSQTSWSILNLLEELTSHGQAILCTIHQPSAMLFQRFHRLLFLGPEGKTVYFGEIGIGSTTVMSYFERNGAKPCPANANPAEWIMETIGCTPGSHSDINWPEVWRHSAEFAQMHRELDEMESVLKHTSAIKNAVKADFREFAAPFLVQLWECFKRVNSQYWRTPSYIYSKTALSVLTVRFQFLLTSELALYLTTSFQALFLGFSFYKTKNNLQGLQNETFSIFMLLYVKDSTSIAYLE